jgi:hypothetical protein
VFISCALKREGVEFCWDCRKNETCERWRNHRAAGKKQDSFKSYQKLEADIGLIKDEGIEAFNQLQKARESRLLKFLTEFNDGRSRSYYCIAVTVMTLDELDGALEEGVRRSNSREIMDRSKMMHTLLDSIACARGYQLKLRKPG